MPRTKKSSITFPIGIQQFEKVALKFSTYLPIKSPIRAKASHL